MNDITTYIEQFEGVKRDWILEFTTYMNKKYPDITGTIWFRMPTYRLGHSYVAFSIAKDYFAFHTNDVECFLMLTTSLSKATFGKKSAKIKFTDDGAKPILYNVIDYFLYKNKNIIE